MPQPISPNSTSPNPTMLSVRDAAREIAARRLSAEDYAKAWLERVAARESAVGAWHYLDRNQVLDAARRRGIAVNLCGQMSGSPTYTMLLLGLGLRQMSVTPSAIPEIKKICRSVTAEHCRSVAARAMSLENARDIKSYLKEELKKILPELAG